MRGSAETLVGLRGILLATLLGPAAFGSWALLRLATRYAALAGVGMFRGLEVELLHAPDDGATRSHAARSALGFMLAVSGALAAASLAVGALVESPAHRLVLQGFAGAVRDVILVPPRTTVKVVFDADNPGLWAYHCHNLYHMAAGMFATVVYRGFN